MMDKALAKKFLFDVADIIEDEFNLPLYLADGTCLGAYRDKDFIDWDTDIDLKMTAEDLIPNCSQLCRAFKRKGFDRVESCAMKKTFSLPHSIVLRREPLHLDICALFLINGHRWTIGRRFSHIYPSTFFDRVEHIKFLGRKFRVPSPVEDYLERVYGAEYMTPMGNNEYQHSSHLLGQIDIKTRIGAEAMT